MSYKRKRIRIKLQMLSHILMENVIISTKFGRLENFEPTEAHSLNFTIFTWISASAHIAERANIAVNACAFDVSITNYFECVIIHICLFYFIWTYRKSPYKIENLFKLWRHFDRPSVFHFWRKKCLFPYRRKCPISPIFLEKNFRRYWACPWNELWVWEA